MLTRIVAIAFIFACTAIAWAVLGSTIVYRTESSKTGLTAKVSSVWGSPQQQAPPSAFYEDFRLTRSESVVNGERIVKVEKVPYSVSLPLESSDIDAGLELDYRRKGLLWYSTYRVGFAGVYAFRNNTAEPREVTFRFPFPASQAIYDDLVFTIDDKAVPVTNQKGEAFAASRLAPRESIRLRVAYRSQGIDTWAYGFGEEVSQVRNFSLRIRTDFSGFDFPENTLAPTRRRPTSNGQELEWNYRNLVAGFRISLALPQRIQPGPLAGQISYFAPVSLFFFFFLMFVITTMRGIELHPMNYFFLAAAFFAFHLLLAYLADHLSIHIAFAICSAVSIGLVISYLRLVAGLRFAVVEAGVSQFVYLVLFSYAFFFQGFTGLAITIGAIVTLFAVMQMTGRIRWSERFAK